MASGQSGQYTQYSASPSHPSVKMCRMFVEESIKDDSAVTDDLEEDLQDLRDIMALGTREADDIVQTAKSTAYT